jgi:hypothetical protein
VALREQDCRGPGDSIRFVVDRNVQHRKVPECGVYEGFVDSPPANRRLQRIGDFELPQGGDDCTVLDYMP